MGTIAHIIVAVIGVGALTDPLTTRWLKTSQNPNRRVLSYGGTICIMAALCALVMFGVTWQPYWAFPPASPLATVAAVLLSAGLLHIVIQPAVKIHRRPELREKTDRAFARLAFVLPQTRRERRWFVPLCLCAGVSEELIFRGFLVDYFRQGLPAVPVTIAVFLSCVVFGLCHFYQGWKGVITTALTGGVFALIAFGFGSLLPGIVLHALVDLRVLIMTTEKSQSGRDRVELTASEAC